MVTVDGPTAWLRMGKSVWATRVVDPAEPMENSYSPPRIDPGWNAISDEPNSAPSIVAPVISAAARNAVRCWRNKPGLRRWPRTFWMRTGFPVMAESERVVRRTYPPPSPSLPSIMISVVMGLCIQNRFDFLEDITGCTAPPKLRVQLQPVYTPLAICGALKRFII